MFELKSWRKSKELLAKRAYTKASNELLVELKELPNIQVIQMMYHEYISGELPHGFYVSIDNLPTSLSNNIGVVCRSITSNQVPVTVNIKLVNDGTYTLELRACTYSDLTVLIDYLGRVMYNHRVYQDMDNHSRTKRLRRVGKGVGGNYVATSSGDESYVTFRNPLLRILHKFKIIGV